MKGEIKLNGKNKLSSMMFVGIIASIFTIITVAVSMVLLFERKKKIEENASSNVKQKRTFEGVIFF